MQSQRFTQNKSNQRRFNAQQLSRNDQANEQNIAARRNEISKFLTSLGNAGGNFQTTMNQNKHNKMEIEALKNIFPDVSVDILAKLLA